MILIVATSCYFIISKINDKPNDNPIENIIK